MSLFSNISPPLIQEALSQPMSLLDLFIPGLSNITTVASQVLNGNMTIYTQLMCLFGLATLLKPYLSQLRDWLLEYCTSTIYIPHSDESRDMMKAWVASRGLDEAARSIIVKVAKQKNHLYHDTCDKKSLWYAPWEGSFFFWYKKSLILYRTTEVTDGFYKRELISITCVGRSPMILKRLTEECRVEYLANSENQTTIYENGNDGWIKDKEVTARPLSTVILHEQQKELLVHDLRRFLDPKTKHRYSTHSIPYKRGYLLYGPPGTGKTSFSLSIAGEADMDIYVINMHSIDDWKLKTLFRSLPKKCVVLLEDIDAAGATCSRSFNPDGPESEREKRSQKKAVTLSGLLNALDGVSSQEDRVLIMTTNHPEKLDDALTRPGRVDLKIAFQLANRSMAKDIYRFMFKESEYDYGDVNQQGNHDEAVKKQRDHDEMVEEQAEAFAAKVPESEFSPAEIMAHLQQHWSSPADAVKHCGQWVHDLLKEKKAKKATSG